MASLFPYYAALFAAIAVGTGGQVLLKVGSARTSDVAAQLFDVFTLLGLAAYGAGAILYIVAIKRIPVSLAYPTVSLSYIVVAVVAHYAWGEALGLPQFAGIALIAGGILLLHHV